MKKRLLTLIVLTCAFVCLLAVCASAKTVYLEPIPDELKVQGDVATHFVVFEEEKYFAVSGSTINGLNNSVMEADMASAGIDASKIGSEYLTRFNFPSHMGTTLITKVDLNGGIKTNAYFSNICGYVQIAPTVSTVTDMNDRTKELRCFDFGENSAVNYIPLCFCAGAQRLKSVKNFPRDITTIEEDAFDKCYMAFSGEFYLNASVIKTEAFNNALSHVTKLVLGPNVQTIGRQSLCVRLPEVPDSCRPADEKMAITEIVFECDVSQVSFYSQGNNSGSFFFTGTSRSEYSKLEKIVLAHPNNERAYKDGMVFNDFTTSGNILFDTTPENDYVTVYHDFNTCTEVRYDNLLAVGEKVTVCGKCGAEQTEDAPALFEFLGYSYKLDSERGGIACGYKVDREALELYQNVMGNDSKFGIVMFNANSDSAKEVTSVFENGVLTISEKKLQIEMSDSKYSIITILINGFNAQTSSTELVIALYMNETVGEGENVQVKTSFAQGVTRQDGTNISVGAYEKSDVTLYKITYNSVTSE